MSEARKRADWPIVAAVVAALLFVPPGVYIGGYFFMSVATWEIEDTKVRVYDSSWQRRIFWLGAAIESTLTGKRVYISKSDGTVTD